VIGVYLVLGVTTVLVLRGMSRRSRAAGPPAVPGSDGFTDHEVPYGPNEPLEAPEVVSVE
jgi:cytochrome bd ubiquinol oxidase subunit I